MWTLIPGYSPAREETQVDFPVCLQKSVNFWCVIDSGGMSTARAEDAQGTPTQSHISPSILVYEEKRSVNPTETEQGVRVWWPQKDSHLFLHPLFMFSYTPCYMIGGSISRVSQRSPIIKSTRWQIIKSTWWQIVKSTWWQIIKSNW